MQFESNSGKQVSVDWTDLKINFNSKTEIVKYFNWIQSKIAYRMRDKKEKPI